MPRVAVRRPAIKRFRSGVSGGGGGGGVGTDSGTARAESGSGSGCCAPREVVAMQKKTARQRISGPLLAGGSPGYNVTMMVPATSRQTRTFEDRADALAHFFLRAGEAPRLLAYDDAPAAPWIRRSARSSGPARWASSRRTT